MDWQRLRLRVAAVDAEAIADALLEAGALAVDLADADAGTAAERPLFGEPGSDPHSAWDDNLVAGLFAGDADLGPVVAGIRESTGRSVAAVDIETVPERDWVRHTQGQFAPIPISPRLWIVPTWCEPPDANAIAIRLDPGLAFGTGSHATTRLCLRWLDRHLTRGATVIDYGCGSGVLAIAARLFGAGRVVGVDIDPQAVAASRANAERNGVEALFLDAGDDAATLAPADVVVANILANPLRVLAPLICGRCRPGGAVVLSGILATQWQDVAAAYEPWLEIEPVIEDEGWVCLWGIRR